MEYVWDRPGINIIQGKNGSGKTTLISALPWVLYGETLKGSVEPWVLGKNYKGTKVTLYLRNGLEDVTIIRCKDYKGKVSGMLGGNKIFLYIGESLITSLRDKKDVQKAINRMMGVSFTLFKNSILFGQKLTRLLQESGTKQKELFDEAFNTAFINTARKSASIHYESLLATLGKQKHSKELLDLKLANQIALLNNKREEKRRVLKERTEALANIDKQLAEIQKFIDNFVVPDKANEDELLSLEKKLANYNNLLLPKKSLDDDYFRKDFEATQLKGEQKALGQDLRSAIVNKNSGICSYCKQPLDSEHKKIHQDTLKRTREEKEKKLVAINNRIVQILDEVSEIDKKLKKLKPIEEDWRKVEARIRTLRAEISKYDPSELKSKKLYKERMLIIRDETASRPLPKFKVKAIIGKVEHCKNLIAMQEAEITRSQKQIDNYVWLINFALSNKGLKAYIFNSLLYSINQELKVFESLLGFRIEFTIDLESGNKNFQASLSQGESKVQYTDLSGGEQQLVDICLALSINSAIPTSNNFNLLILDEVFESLDPSNTELISDILVEKAKTKNIHLVTHNLGFSCPSINKITTLSASSAGTRKVR
jgi:DNA repair exonuclease SbcCD ATPase subunit